MNIISTFLKLFKIYDDLIFSMFSMNLSRNYQNAAILKIIKISKIDGRFTANYSKFLASNSIRTEMWYNFTLTIVKIWKIWALCCQICSFECRWVHINTKRYTTLVHTMEYNTLFSDFLVSKRPVVVEIFEGSPILKEYHWTLKIFLP